VLVKNPQFSEQVVATLESSAELSPYFGVGMVPRAGLSVRGCGSTGSPEGGNLSGMCAAALPVGGLYAQGWVANGGAGGGGAAIGTSLGCSFGVGYYL
jgi:hypothetical protein